MSVAAKDRWTKDVDNYDLPHLRLRTIAHLINEIKPKEVADLGCAKGTLRKLIPSVNYSGCDFIEPHVNIDFKFYQCEFNLEKLPSEINGIEMIVASGLLEYIEDLPLFISQVRDVLHEKGIFIATYFNMNHIARRWQELRGMPVYTHPDWKGMYSFDDLNAIFIKNGFRVKKVIPFTHSLFSSKAVNETVKGKVRIDRFHIYSTLLAHQFIFTCEKVGYTDLKANG